jgi:murein DD-endopeptidase MepM/ murein hydrolase activator NlpD
VTSAVIMAQLALNPGWGMRNMFNAIGGAWADGNLMSISPEVLQTRLKELSGFGYSWQVDDLSAFMGQDLTGQGTFGSRVIDMVRTTVLPGVLGTGAAEEWVAANPVRYRDLGRSISAAQSVLGVGKLPGVAAGMVENIASGNPALWLESKALDVFYGESTIPVLGIGLGERANRLRTGLSTMEQAISKWSGMIPERFVGGIEKLGLSLEAGAAESLNRLLSTLTSDIKKYGGANAMDFYSKARRQVGEMAQAGQISSGDSQRILRYLQEETLPQMMTMTGAVAEAGARGSEFTMLDPRKTQNYQEWIGGTFLYSYFRTQSLVNWAERLGNAPALVAGISRLTRANEKENEQSGVPASQEGTIPAPWLWENARIPAPWNLAFPMGVLTARDWEETQEEPGLASGFFAATNAASLTPNPIARVAWDMYNGESLGQSVLGQMPQARFFMDSPTFDYQVGLTLATMVEKGEISREDAYLAMDVRMSSIRNVSTGSLTSEQIMAGQAAWDEAAAVVRTNQQWASGTSMGTGVRVSTLDPTGAQVKEDADKYFLLAGKGTERDERNQKNWLNLHPGIEIRWVSSGLYPNGEIEKWHDSVKQAVRPDEGYPLSDWMENEYEDWKALDPLNPDYGTSDSRAILAWVQSGMKEGHQKAQNKASKKAVASHRMGERDLTHVFDAPSDTATVPMTIPFARHDKVLEQLEERDADGDIIEKGSSLTRQQGQYLPYDELMELAPPGPHSVYLLIDPTTGMARYVGKTNSPQRRIVEHLTHPFEQPDHPKSQWILEVYSKGQFPYMRVIEDGISDADIDTREQIWIGYLAYISGNVAVNVDIPTREEWDDMLVANNLTYADLAEQAEQFMGMNTVLPSSLYDKLDFDPTSVIANTYGYVDPFDLGQLVHLGDTTVEKLNANGVFSLQQLATMSSLEIAQYTELSDKRAEEVRIDAQRLQKVTTAEPYYSAMEYMSLEDMAGVGAVTADKILAAGYTDISSLAGGSVQTLVTAGISESNAKKLIAQAASIVQTDAYNVEAAAVNQVVGPFFGGYPGLPILPFGSEGGSSSGSGTGASTGANVATGPTTLADLSGIGPVMEGDLWAAGITTIEELAYATVQQLDSIQGIGIKTAKKIIDEAREVTGMEERRRGFLETGPRPRGFFDRAGDGSVIPESNWKRAGVVPWTSDEYLGDLQREAQNTDAPDRPRFRTWGITNINEYGDLEYGRVTPLGGRYVGGVFPFENPALMPNASTVRMDLWRNEEVQPRPIGPQFGSEGIELGDLPPVTPRVESMLHQAGIWVLQDLVPKSSAEIASATGMTLDEAQVLIDSARGMVGGPLLMPFRGSPVLEQGFAEHIKVYEKAYGRPGASHGGLDYALPIGTPLYPSKSGGVVTWVGSDADGNNGVVITYADGSETKYSHLMSMPVAMGQAVGINTIIGVSGDTGGTNLAHLHFDYRPPRYDASGKHDGYIDPSGMMVPRQQSWMGSASGAAGTVGAFTSYASTVAQGFIGRGKKIDFEDGSVGWDYLVVNPVPAVTQNIAPEKTQANGKSRGIGQSIVNNTDLTVLAGVGEVTAEKLRAQGYETVKDVANAEVADLDAIPGISPDGAVKIINDARDMIGEVADAQVIEEISEDVEDEKKAEEGIDIYDLTALPGVGDAKAQILRDAGFNSVLDVANASVEQIAALKGFGDTTAPQLVIGARALLGDDTMYLPFIGDADFAQGFGEHPENYARFGLEGHEGLDWMLDEGSSLYSAGEGKVKTVGWDSSGYGIYVVVQHADGSETLYAHLSEASVTEGDSVTATTLVGKSGDTGNSSGPHLHFGYRPPNDNQDNGFNGFIDPTDLFMPRGGELPDLSFDSNQVFTPEPDKVDPVGSSAGIAGNAARAYVEKAAKGPVTGVGAEFLMQQMKKDTAKVKKEEEKEEEKDAFDYSQPIEFISEDGLVKYNEYGQRLDSLGHVAWRGDGTTDVNEKFANYGKYLREKRAAYENAQNPVNAINDPRLEIPLAPPVPTAQQPVRQDKAPVSAFGASWQPAPTPGVTVQAAPSSAATQQAAVAAALAESLRLAELERLRQLELERIREEEARKARERVMKSWRRAMAN